VLVEPEEAAAFAARPDAARSSWARRDRPVVVIDLRRGDGGADLAPLATLPLVVVGAGGAHDACDVVVDDADAAIDVMDAVARNPQAAVTLVQLLRVGAHLDPLDALVAESLAYATLQSGGEFASWLDGRGERVRKPEDEPPVLVSRRDDTLRIELNRPRLHNLFNAAMRDELADSLALASADDTIGVVQLSGRGKSFCAGGDPAEFGTVSDPATAHLIRSAANVAPLLVAVADRLRVHVHGAAVGAGCELAAFASHVTGAEDTTFRLPEVSMGLVPGAGGTVSVTRRIGRQRAAWLMLTGAALDAPTALEWGLVDEIL
jgi:hypothetical protein